MDEVDKIANRLDQIEKSFGLWGVIFAIGLGVFFIALWTYFKTSIQKTAEKSADESLKKIQSHLDKELVKFSTTHQKQVDAVHECYLRLQRLTSTINESRTADKFKEGDDSSAKIELVIKYRHDFKQVYGENRILFPRQVCDKLDQLLPVVDGFIEFYQAGLCNFDVSLLNPDSKEESGIIITGLWESDKYDEMVDGLRDVGHDIEEEFRKIYGTE